MIYKYLFLSCRLSVHLLLVDFATQKILFGEVNLFIIFLWLLVILVSYLKNHCLIQGHADLKLCLFLSFIILALSLIHIDLIFVCDVW